MARLKKRRLRWKASESPQVVGYRLYWATGGTLGYDSACADLGNVTEVVLPDDIDNFPMTAGPVDIGITAVDELGNESDMITLQAPYQFDVPAAPTDLKFEAAREFFVKEAPDEQRGRPGAVPAEPPADRPNTLPFADLFSLETRSGGK